MEHNSGQNHLSLAMLLLLTKERPETTSGERRGHLGCKRAEEKPSRYQQCIGFQGTEAVGFLAFSESSLVPSDYFCVISQLHCFLLLKKSGYFPWLPISNSLILSCFKYLHNIIQICQLLV